MMPVSFEVIVAYMQDGLVLEELVRATAAHHRQNTISLTSGTASLHYYAGTQVVKRQRCCTGTARGAALSILHDFFILTHEYLAVFRKPDPASATAPPAAPLWRPIAGVPGLPDAPVTDTLTTAVPPCDRCNPATALATASPPSNGDRAVVNGWALQTTTKAVPVVPLAGRNRVLGTVWTFQASDVAGLHRLATAQLV